MFSNVFEDESCELCNGHYNMSIRTHMRNYYCCYNCERNIKNVIANDEITSGRLLVYSWYAPENERCKKTLVTSKFIDKVISQNQYLRISDYIHIKSDGSIDVCLFCLEYDDFLKRYNTRQYYVIRLELYKLATYFFHLPIPCVNDVSSSASLKESYEKTQSHIVKHFINESRCILVLRIISNRTYDDCTLLYLLPKDVIYNIINIYVTFN